MQAKLEVDLSRDHDLGSVNQDFYENLKISDAKQGDLEEHDDDVEGGGEEGEEFSFMCGGGVVSSPVAAEDAFVDGKIKPTFPLFSGRALHEDLPIRPPVKKILVEQEDDEGCKTTSCDEEAIGPYCEWSSGRKAVEASSPVVCNKSNSTGFSKIWRLRDLVGRCNSDGRDAYVFLNKNNLHPEKNSGESGSSDPVGKKTQRQGKKNKNGRDKTTPLSAHEIYLKRKAKEDERRRSYLPYRPELMGLFTNVTGGLSKNVHPY